MVYCGRPSGSCYACRERKSRCDKLPEGCTQCKKAKRECPGYRKLGDVIFHIENETVARKAKLKEAKNKAKRDGLRAPLPPMVEVEGVVSTIAPDAEHGEVFIATMEDQWADVVPHVEFNPSDLILLPPLEDIADGYFISNFVTTAQGDYAGPLRFDYLADFYRENSMDAGLVASLRAVGLARYAHTSKSLVLLQKARLQYTQAIQHTNKSLKCPRSVKKDSTLVSILVLGIFEIITGCQQQSLKDWAQHVSGAAAVVALRGPEQIHSIIGRRILFQVTSNLGISCLFHGQAFPEFIYRITRSAMERVNTPDPGLEVQRVILDVTQLRADIFAGTLKNSQIIMDEAIKWDCYLLALTEDLSTAWRYETVYTNVKSSYVYNGKYHLYSGCWMAQLWNMVRVLRVGLNETIRDALLKGFATRPPLFPLEIHAAQFKLVNDTIYELQLDILSSVPQHLFAPVVSKVHKAAEFPPQPTGKGIATPKGADATTVLSKYRAELQLRQAQKEASYASNIDRHIAMQLRTARQRAETAAAIIENHIEPQLRQLLAHSTTSSSPRSAFTADDPSTPGRAHGGNFLIWPLWFAGVMDIATEEVRTFVIRNLRDLSDRIGINQGHVLANMLEKRPLLGAPTM